MNYQAAGSGGTRCNDKCLRLLDLQLNHPMMFGLLYDDKYQQWQLGAGCIGWGLCISEVRSLLWLSEGIRML